MLGVPTPIPIPNLQRLYFKFGQPIDPAALIQASENIQQNVHTDTNANTDLQGSNAMMSEGQSVDQAHVESGKGVKERRPRRKGDGGGGAEGKARSAAQVERTYADVKLSVEQVGVHVGLDTLYVCVSPLCFL